jgi:acetyl-CoA C-acetyltransferase
MDDADVPAEDVDVVHVGNFVGELLCGQAHLGGMIASITPAFAGLPTSRHEAACASGSVAVLGAMAEIEAGRYDVALVVGAEVLRTVPGQTAAELMGSAAWVGREAVGAQFPWPDMFATIAEEYDTRWGLEHEVLGRIAEVNFSTARRNPFAQTRDWVPPGSFDDDDDLNPVVSGMLRKQDCGRITDGSAAVILASEQYAAEHARQRGKALGELPVIRGWGHTTGPLLLEDKLRSSVGCDYVFPHVRAAVDQAFERARIGDVSAVDVAEVHDCFTISEYIAIDHLGITPPGESWRAVEEGIIDFGGALPVNPSGGLIGLGHPVGATGVRMLLDATRQVTGTAGDYQVPGARTAMTLNIGGSFTTVVSFVVGMDGDD